MAGHAGFQSHEEKCGAGALLNMTHAVGWAVCGLSAAAVGWPHLASEWRAVWAYAAPLVALAPGTVALLVSAGSTAADALVSRAAGALFALTPPLPCSTGIGP